MSNFDLLIGRSGEIRCVAKIVPLQLQTNAAPATWPNVNVRVVPRCVNSTSDPCCILHEWLVFPLRGSTEFCADAAFSTLRARTA